MSFTVSDTVTNDGEVFRLPLQLLFIVNNESNVNVSYRNINKFAITCKFFSNALYDSEIIAI